jgi:DivIVA domain-containing protein
MPLTPEDVANKQFTSTRLKPGYDETEVDEFLDEVEAELTRLYRENDELRSKLTNAQRQLAEGGGDGGSAQQAAPPAPIPQPAAPPPPPPAPVPAPVAQVPAGATVSETATGILALAQRTADEHVSEARTQADRIIGEARTRADQLKREADDKHRQMIGSLENERVTLEREVEKLRTFEREYRTRLKSYLEGQLRELDGRPTQAPGGSGSAGPSNPVGQPAASGQPGQAPRSPFSPGAPVGGGNSGGQQSPSGPGGGPPAFAVSLRLPEGGREGVLGSARRSPAGGTDRAPAVPAARRGCRRRRGR